MKIKTLAAASEILASIAVIVSLVFVIVSLNQNTAALQSINDDFLYELQDARLSAVQNDTDLANILVKVFAGEFLGPAERVRFDYWMIREINMWELAFIRHSEGLMPPAQWVAWETSFITSALPYVPKETWDEWRSGYGEEFREYMDQLYLDHP